MIRIFLKRVIQPKILNKKILSVSFLTSIKNIDASNKKILLKECSNDDDDDDIEYEDMFVKTIFKNVEWGGPLRGGRLPEPTRFGDWERKGRCTDY